MIDGKIVEVGLVGSDGMSGLTALMGEETSPERAIVQIPDQATRVELRVIKEDFMRGGQLHKLLLKYARRLMRQVSQTEQLAMPVTQRKSGFLVGSSYVWIALRELS